MAVVEAPTLRRSGSVQPATAIAVVVILALVGRASDLAETQVAQTFTLIFTAIFIEALPFVFLGAIVSAAIEIFVPDRTLDRITRLPVALQLPTAALGGFAFPVCECGSVPVARRLLMKGMDPTAGIAFMLAAPIFNPVVLISTWVAYSPRGFGAQMVVGRGLLGLVTAMAVGWTLGTEKTEQLVRTSAKPASRTEDRDADHRKRERFLGHVSDEFLFMARFLMLGAALSAGIQTFLPQSLLGGIAGTVVVGTLALMAIAFVSSLCSEGDAFVAVSFSQFPLGAQLAFLTFGPILDLKLAFLYSAVFARRFVLKLACLAIPIVVAGSLIFQVFTR